MINKEIIWLANYYFRVKTIASRELKKLDSINIQPKYKDRQVKRYTLKQYIEFLGMPEAARLFNISEASIKAWRYGYRQPSISQAKKIIKATDGRLDFESIYGEMKDIVEA